MIANEVFYYFYKAIPKVICDDIVKYGNSLIKEKAFTGSSNYKKIIRPLKRREIKQKDKVRKSKVAWINDPWVYREIRPYIERANKEANWNFQIHGYEPIQFTEYSKNEHYNYHIDTFHGQGNQTRKLSMTVNLTDPKEYEGGDLYFKYLRRDNLMLIEQTNKEIKERGTVCVFPSYEAHKVTPVTKGVRNSLVLWSTGNPFI
jgi:PKHD-type hydroxylase|tara:strand:- start:93 stop:701 length:609 start_codon:yes stop_codon:yes gene_type:complete